MLLFYVNFLFFRCRQIWNKSLQTANAKVLIPLSILLILSMVAAIVLGIKLWRTNQQKIPVKSFEDIQTPQDSNEQEVFNAIVS